MRQKRTRILAFILATVMLLGFLPATALADGTIKVVVDFEGYNLGQGFYVEPTVMEVPVGSTAAYVTDALLTQMSMMYSKTGTIESGFFLDRIKGIDTGTVVLPSYLEEPIEDYWGGLDDGSSDRSLGSNDYVEGMAGWMITVNHVLITVGAGDRVLADNDVIRWQFSLWGIGTDLGVPGFDGPPLYEHADKTELLLALTADGANASAKPAALAVVIDPLATAQEVADAIAALGESGGSGGVEAAAPVITALTVNSTAVAGFDPEILVYTVDVKGKAASTVVATFDDAKYTLSYSSTDYASGDSVTVSTPANSGITAAELTLTDKNNPENTTAYTLKLVNPRAITVTKKFELAPSTGALLSNVLINTRAEGLLFQADASGAATGTSVTHSATVNNYRAILLTETDSIDIKLGDLSPTTGYIRVFADGVEIIAPTSASSATLLMNLPIKANGVSKITLELCTAATYAANDNSFVVENAYNLFVDQPNLPETELAKVKITTMTLSAGELVAPFTVDSYEDTIWVKAADGTDITYSLTVADVDTKVFKNLTSSTTANTLTPSNGVYTLAAKASEPFVPQLMQGFQTPFATERVINDYTIRYQYKILYDTAVTSGGGDAAFEVVDYIVPASQYTNKPTYGMNGHLLPGGKLISLGNFGGYVTAYFEDGIKNDPKNLNGVDLFITGNAFDNAAGASEPGNVWVSEDNVNWYLLAGSDYFDDNTIRDYEVTYVRGFNGVSQYTDNYNQSTLSAYETMYGYPLKKNYPLHTWADGGENSMTFTGPLLLGGSGTDAGFPLWGYVDSTSGTAANPYTSRGQGFDLDWAIDEATGKPVTLTEVHYVKVATASHIYAGSIGEKSTEVSGMTVATPGGSAVGKTAAPTAIKINGDALELTDGVYEYSTGFGTGALNVEVEGAGSATVFINNKSGATRNYTVVPASNTVRIVVQSGSSEPVIYYITDGIPTDKTALAAAISAATALTAADYTAESWNAVDTALTAAQGINANGGAMQVAIDSATEALNDAISALELKSFAPVSYSDQMNASLAYILSTVTTPALGTGHGEWSILALARAGYDVPDGYYDGYIARIIASLEAAEAAGRPAGQLDASKATENERLILGLAAIGINPANVGGYNVLAPLSNYDWVIGQGTNSTIFALLAFDANNYEIPEVEAPKTQNSRQKLIDRLIDREVKKGTADAGGWTLFGTTVDIDMTAMAIQALAPYYSKDGYGDVTAAVDRALAVLSSIQREDGGFTYGGKHNSQSNAQVIVALTALGIDPQVDGRFVKADGNPVSALLTFYVDGGGFMNTPGTNVNAMGTDQCTYALVAYDRFLKNKTALYDMSDVTPRTDPEYKTVLNALIAQVEQLSVAKYTATTWSALQTELTAAKTVLANVIATKQELTDAEAALRAAVAGLQTVGGGTTTPTTPAINVSFRLIGAGKSTADIDLENGGYNGSEYVTWIPTRMYSMNEGDTVYDLFVKAIGDAGLTAVGANQNYVKSIKAPAVLGGFTLGEFTNGKYSGWMYTINGRHMGYGLKEQIITDGDTVIWHYVNDYRFEVSDWFNDASYPSMGAGTHYSKWLKAADVVPAAGSGSGTGGGVTGDTEDTDEVEISDNETALGAFDEDKLFDDVNSDNWFYDAIKYVVENGLMNGISDSAFAPDAKLTRAMLVTILYRYEGEPTVEDGTDFTDVSGGQWYSDAIVWASENGVANGYGDGRFGANDSITREQLAVMLYNYARLKGFDVSQAADLSAFDDSAEISTWAGGALAWANAVGLINGRTETTLAPAGTATRAEAATILMRFIESFVKQ